MGNTSARKLKQKSIFFGVDYGIASDWLKDGVRCLNQALSMESLIHDQKVKQ